MIILNQHMMATAKTVVANFESTYATQPTINSDRWEEYEEFFYLLNGCYPTFPVQSKLV